MNIYRGCEAYRLFFFVMMMQPIVPVSSRPQRGGGGGGRRTRRDSPTQGHNDDPSGPPASSTTHPCQAVPTQDLWIRLNAAYFSSDQYDLADFPTSPKKVTESHSLRHSSGTLSHSNSHPSKHSNGQLPDLLVRNRRGAKTGRKRHKDRRREAKKRSKRRNKLHKKLMKKVSRTKDLQVLEQEYKCEFEQMWTDLGPDYFPSTLHTGRCQQSNCMFGFYECKEKTYEVPVLHRDYTLDCNPLPRLGEQTVYEEAWTVETVKAVVGCECTPILTRL